jgi:hypothetical protein
VFKRVTSPIGFQIIGLVVIATGVIDETQRETAQAWAEVIAGTVFVLIGSVRSRPGRR